MKTEVRLPDLGDDANQDASVSMWYIEEGEMIKAGEDLIEMNTDKAAFTVPSPESGTLVERVVQEGETISVGDVIAILET